MPRGATPGRNTPVRGASDRLRGAWVVNRAWWGTLRTVDPDGTVRLVGAILRGTPSLPGAACRGRHELYNDVVREDPATRADGVTDEQFDIAIEAKAPLSVRCGDRSGRGTGLPGAGDHRGDVLHGARLESGQPRQARTLAVGDHHAVQRVELVACPGDSEGVAAGSPSRAGHAWAGTPCAAGWFGCSSLSTCCGLSRSGQP